MSGGLGVAPTEPPGTPLSAGMPWDESTRPTAPRPGETAYTEQGRLVSQHLVDVHDALRAELEKVRDIVEQVVAGARTSAVRARPSTQCRCRRRDWTLGGYCQAYCRIITSTTRSRTRGSSASAAYRAGLAPVVDRLVEEAPRDPRRARGSRPGARRARGGPRRPRGLREAVDLMTDTLLSHFAYEDASCSSRWPGTGCIPGSRRQAAAQAQRGMDRPCPWRRERNATLLDGLTRAASGVEGSPSNVPVNESTSSPSES